MFAVGVHRLSGRSGRRKMMEGMNVYVCTHSLIEMGFLRVKMPERMNDRSLC